MSYDQHKDIKAFSRLLTWRKRQNDGHEFRGDNELSYRRWGTYVFYLFGMSDWSKRFGVLSKHVLVHFTKVALFMAAFPMWMDLLFRGLGIISPYPRWYYNAPIVESILDYPRANDCFMYSFFWVFAFLKMGERRAETASFWYTYG